MQYVLQVAVLFFSVIVHEVAHGYVAYKRGDDTAKNLGRLTLNPLPHMDIIGSIVMPAVLVMCGLPAFGWAKPVPVNVYRLKNPKTDTLLVSVAGVAANFGLAVISAVIIFALKNFAVPGSAVSAAYMIFYMMIVINVILGVFNLIPVPPLDGSRVLLHFLPHELAVKYARLEPYGFFIIILLLVTNILWKFISPVIIFIINFLTGRF